MGRILTFLLTSVLFASLPLILLLTGVNVNLCSTTTYAPGVRLIFGYLKLTFWQGERKPFRAQVSLLFAKL